MHTHRDNSPAWITYAYGINKYRKKEHAYFHIVAKRWIPFCDSV